MEAVKQFFENNPDATECYSALGIVKATKEEAEALLGGTTEKVILRHAPSEAPAEEEPKKAKGAGKKG